jgi:hypothetical protein
LVIPVVAIRETPNFEEKEMINVATDTTLSVVRKIGDLWSAGKSDSLIDYTRPSRVEPLCLVDARVINAEATPQVMQSLVNIISAYYLQAVAISTNVGNVSVIGALDRLSPNRNPLDTAIGAASGDGIGASIGMMSMEAYQDRLPTPQTAQKALEFSLKRIAKQEAKIALEDGVNAKPLDIQGTMREMANLSVGKLLNVEISDGANKATIPVSVRLMANVLPTENMVHILAAGNKDTTMKGRWHQWRSGEIEFIADLVLCQDLISAHRKNLMSDKTGIFASIMKTRRGNWLSGFLSANPTIAVASNVVVMAKTTQDMIELEANGDMNNFAFREKLFAPTYIMLMAVIDEQWDRITFYHRGIAHATNVSLRDLKAANGSGGPDVSDILQAYRIGNAPAL